MSKNRRNVTNAQSAASTRIFSENIYVSMLRFAVVWLGQIQNLDAAHVYFLGFESGSERLLTHLYKYFLWGGGSVCVPWLDYNLVGKFKNNTNCVNEPGASRLRYYCASICVRSWLFGMLSVWIQKQNKQKKGYTRGRDYFKRDMNKTQSFFRESHRDSKPPSCGNITANWCLTHIRDAAHTITASQKYPVPPNKRSCLCSLIPVWSIRSRSGEQIVWVEVQICRGPQNGIGFPKKKKIEGSKKNSWGIMLDCCRICRD